MHSASTDDMTAIIPKLVSGGSQTHVTEAAARSRIISLLLSNFRIIEAELAAEEEEVVPAVVPEPDPLEAAVTAPLQLSNSLVKMPPFQPENS
jgi:hypothetical protein